MARHLVIIRRLIMISKYEVSRLSYILKMSSRQFFYISKKLLLFTYFLLFDSWGKRCHNVEFFTSLVKKKTKKKPFSQRVYDVNGFTTMYQSCSNKFVLLKSLSFICTGKKNFWFSVAGIKRRRFNIYILFIICFLLFTSIHFLVLHY